MAYISRPPIANGPYFRGGPYGGAANPTLQGTSASLQHTAYGPSFGAGVPGMAQRTWQPGAMGTAMGANPMAPASMPPPLGPGAMGWAPIPHGVNAGLDSIMSTMQPRNVDIRGFVGGPVQSSGYMPPPLYQMQEAQTIGPGDGGIWPPPVRQNAPESFDSREILGGYFPAASAAGARLSAPEPSYRKGLRTPTRRPAGDSRGTERRGFEGGAEQGLYSGQPTVVIVDGGRRDGDFDFDSDDDCDRQTFWNGLMFIVLLVIIVACCILAGRLRDTLAEIAILRSMLGGKPPSGMTSAPGAASVAEGGRAQGSTESGVGA